MDAFYASVEQRDHPELKGKPIAVGGSKERGVVAAASYEARKYGVKSAMPSSLAAKKCKDLIFVKPRFEVYKSVSEHVHEIFHEYTDLVEPLSLDEAYLDVTANKFDIEFGMDVALEIRDKIYHKTGLTASAGISYNKFLAKIASDYNKPNGYFVITPKRAIHFLEQLPIEKFFGIGKVTAEKMHQRNILFGYNLKKQSLEDLTKWFGKAGRYYYNVVRGIDNRVVNPNRIRKSIGAERTFLEDIVGFDALAIKLKEVEEILINRLERSNRKGRTITLKVKYGDFNQITRSRTKETFWSQEELNEIALLLLKEIKDLDRGVRLLGLSVSNFDEESDDQFMGRQMNLNL